MSTRQTESEGVGMLPLSKIFSFPSASKILDFLLTNPDFDYSASDLARLTSISPRSIQRTLPYLLDEHLIIRTGKSGKAFMYKADLGSSRTNALLEYIKSTQKEILQQQRPA